MTERFRILPHPSDVGFEVHGADHWDLCDAAVAALAYVTTGGRVPEAVETMPVTQHPDDDDETRLVRLLDACIVLLDTEGWLAVGVDAEGSAFRGAPMSEDARSNGVHVKAITWHGLSIVAAGDGLMGRVFVDL